MAGDTPQTGATTTRLLRWRHGHRVRRAPSEFARRPSRGDASQPLAASRKRRQKGDGGTFPRLSLRSSTRGKGPRSRRQAEFAASDSYRGRHDNRPCAAKVEGALHHRPENPAHMRDSRSQHGETRTRTGDTTIFSRYVLAAAGREIPVNEQFLRVGLAPLIFAICAGFHAFQGMAGLPSPFGRAVCLGGEPEVGALVRRPDSHRSERRCRFGRGARSASGASV
jgi:hypothetical protein